MAEEPGTLRLFFALQAEAVQSAALVERVAPWVARLGAQRVPAGNIHATLCFLGAVPAAHVAHLQAVAAGQHFAPAELCFDKLEYWRKPRILCATAAGDGAASLHGLAASLARATQAAGFKPDVKPFHPHLTLARKVHAARAEQCAWPQALVPATVVRCERFVLMESRRGATGSIYSVVASWPLDE